MVRTLARKAHRIISTDNPLPVVCLVDGLLYCLLSTGIIAGANSLYNRLHPHNTYTINFTELSYGSFLFTQLLFGLLVVAASAFFTSATHKRFMFVVRSTRHTVVSTICVVTATSGAAWLAIWLLDGPITDPLTLVQIIGMFGLAAATGGYRLWGFVQAKQIDISINGSPAIPVDPTQSTLLATDGKTTLSYQAGKDKK